MEITPKIASNVNHLFNTNSTPSPEQRNNLQNFVLEIDEAILNTDEDISGINEQILALQTKIAAIQTRRAQLIQQRTQYSSLLSPVRRLPLEIFGKIFDYATRDCTRHVLNLSAVCQLWRYAALNTPVLWSTLELGHHTKIHNTINHITSWVERAHSYPLSLIIKKLDSEYYLDPVDYVLTLIADHQWKSITLDSDNRKSTLPFLKKLKFSNLEMLESLSLTMRFPDHRLVTPEALQLGHTPKLKTLALSMTIQHGVSFDMLPFPWGQLTSLSISFWSSSNLALRLDILQACVNLEEFIMGGVGSSGGLGLNRSITLNYLRKLHACSFGNSFLLSLVTPSIQDFVVKGRPNHHHTRPSDDFYDYFTKNGLTLLKLSIAPFSSSLIQYIQFLRSLVELRLYDNNYDSDGSVATYEVLNSLLVKPEMDPSTIPLPRLQVLEIICRATERNQRIFMEVVDSRWWSDAEENTRQKEGRQSLSRIKYAVLMDVRTELNMFYRKDVDVLRAQGMKIEYLAPFDGMDKDDFYTSRLHSITVGPSRIITC